MATLIDVNGVSLSIKDTVLLYVLKQGKKSLGKLCNVVREIDGSFTLVELLSYSEKHRLALYESYLDESINGVIMQNNESKYCFEIVGNSGDNPYCSLDIKEHFHTIWKEYYMECKKVS